MIQLKFHFSICNPRFLAPGSNLQSHISNLNPHRRIQPPYAILAEHRSSIPNGGLIEGETARKLGDGSPLDARNRAGDRRPGRAAGWQLASLSDSHRSVVIGSLDI